MKLAVQATLHCLLGCSIGEVVGMVVSAALGWGNTGSVAASVALAFVFGYLLTYRIVRSIRVTVASETVSIATMELVDNAFILVVPGAIAAGLGDGLFWWSLAVSLVIAFAVALPVNWLQIRHGRGHAAMHHAH